MFHILVLSLAIAVSHGLKVEQCGFAENYLDWTGERYYAAGVYNGGDNIYFIGGQSRHNEPVYTKKVFKLDVNGNGSVEVVGEFPHYDGYSDGVATIDSNFHIYYQGGTYEDDRGIDTYYYFTPDIFQISASNGNPQDVGRSFGIRRDGASAVSIGDVAYIFGGDYHDDFFIEEFNMKNQTSRKVGSLPVGISSSAAAYNGKHVYLFGGWSYHGKRAREIFRFDPVTFEMEKLEAELPFGIMAASAAIVDNMAIIIGGNREGFNKNIVLFDIATQTISQADVTLDSLGGVALFVPSKNKIYVSSGHILCVDRTFDCTGKPDGRYPHPSECSKFIICSNEITNEMDCPAGLHFSPTVRDCHYPHEAGCTQ